MGIGYQDGAIITPWRLPRETRSSRLNVDNLGLVELELSSASVARDLRHDLIRIGIANSALELTRHQAESAKIAKSTVLAKMRHEIRTPLTGIVRMVNILRCESVTPGQAARSLVAPVPHL